MTARNVLGAQDTPRFHLTEVPWLAPPEPGLDVAVRAAARSLAGMQKEGIVRSSATGRTWRLVSDEGPYLAGHDEAPFPLAFLGAGMAASYAGELVALAEQRGLDPAGFRLALHNRYTMEGSALRGTMVGGALAPEVGADLPEVPADLVRPLLADALDASPVNGLLRVEHAGRFSLRHGGRAVAAARVAPLDGQPPWEPLPSVLPVEGPHDADDLLTLVTRAEEREGVPGGKGSSLQAEQRRTLHVETVCSGREDGRLALEVVLHQPLGSRFRVLADPRGVGAPDPATLLAAGIAFCFMTQLGRYATIARWDLPDYRVVQDLHLSHGGATDGTGRPGRARPVDTHVDLVTDQDDEAARTLVHMGEQTCFLHALCRTPLKPRIRASALEHAR
jgi:uncharacterized OsmC-like protein